MLLKVTYFISVFKIEATNYLPIGFEYTYLSTKLQ